ncbi:hypothetical protein HY641_05145 [Candidatus Woesearchaeota archaeon]|nr:hypothetical protein [Candidatus Woesearchaeota archaeon]
MILPDDLKTIIRDQRITLGTQDTTIPRELAANINLKTTHALIISGIRRCDKSTLLCQLRSKNDCYSKSA